MLINIRDEFPILQQSVNQAPLIYFDSAATSQKPRRVIEAISDFYSQDYASVHRGVHALSDRATDAYESARVKVQKHVNASRVEEIIFVRGTTEGLNLIAQTFGRQRLEPGDNIIVTMMEHHANIVSWQLLQKEIPFHIKVAPINENGELLVSDLKKLIDDRTKLISVVHVSNTLGTVNPIKTICDFAHAQGVPVIVDGAQAVPHMQVDVQDLNCDFYVYSGHKIYGPSGIGIVYGKYDLLEAMPPYQGGGAMIDHVSFHKTTFLPPPQCFEAGTPNITGAVALGVALDFVHDVGLQAIASYEQQLLAFASEKLSTIEGVRILGEAPDKASVLSFVVEGIHAHDIGTLLDQKGIAVRTGHHCTMPLMQFFEVSASVRASFAIYNTEEEITQFYEALTSVLQLLR